MTKKPTPKATKPAKATKPVNKSRSTTPKKAAPKVVSKPRVTAPKPVRAIEPVPKPSPAGIIIEEFIAPPKDFTLRTHDAWRGYTADDKQRFATNEDFKAAANAWSNQQWNAAIQDTQATTADSIIEANRKAALDRAVPLLYAIGAIVAGLAIWWGVSLL